LQFCSRGKAPYIEKIQPIKTALLTKGEWRAKFGDISWPAEAIEKFPEILRFGCQEGE